MSDGFKEMADYLKDSVRNGMKFDLLLRYNKKFDAWIKTLNQEELNAVGMVMKGDENVGDAELLKCAKVMERLK